ncbi:MAG: hypothetical protein HY063_09840 [Bacteroidetes bacterium]|nr:hypothetical protein [Bacteroidota bacterium]
MFHSDDPLFRWNGSAKGNKLDSGAYTYYMNATLNDTTEINRKGTVNLMR